MRLLGFLVIALNIPLFVVTLSFAVKSIAMPATYMFALIPLVAAVNIIVPFRQIVSDFENALKGRGWIVFINLVVALLSFIFIYLDETIAKVFGTSVLAVSLVSIFFYRRLNLPVIPQPDTSYSGTPYEDELDTYVNIGELSEQLSQKLFRASKRREKIKNAMLYVGSGALFLAVFKTYLSFEIGYPFDTRAEEALTAFFYFISFICLLLWRFFNAGMLKKKAMADLIIVGIPERRAYQITEREYKEKKMGEYFHQWWRQYQEKNREAIERHQAEFESTLANKYGLKKEVNVTFSNLSFPDITPATQMFFNKKTPEELAESVYEGIMKLGEAQRSKFFIKDDQGNNNT